MKKLISRNIRDKKVAVKFRNFHAQCAKREILLHSTKNIFREINSLVTSLIKNVIFTKFSSKSVRENLLFFRTALNCGKDTLTFFWQKFRESNVITIELSKQIDAM